MKIYLRQIPTFYPLLKQTRKKTSVLFEAVDDLEKANSRRGVVYIRLTKTDKGIRINKVIWIPRDCVIDSAFIKKISEGNTFLCIEAVSDKICKTEEDIRLELTMMTMMHKYVHGNRRNCTLDDIVDKKLEFNVPVSRLSYYDPKISTANRKEFQYFLNTTVDGLTRYAIFRMQENSDIPKKKKKHKKKKRKD